MESENFLAFEAPQKIIQHYLKYINSSNSSGSRSRNDIYYIILDKNNPTNIYLTIKPINLVGEGDELVLNVGTEDLILISDSYSNPSKPSKKKEKGEWPPNSNNISKFLIRFINEYLYSKKPFESDADYRILEAERENIQSEEDLIRDLSQHLTEYETEISEFLKQNPSFRNAYDRLLFKFNKEKELEKEFENNQDINEIYLNLEKKNKR